MKNVRNYAVIAVMVLGVALIGLNSDAQDRRERPGGFGDANPEARQERMIELMKGRLGADDAQWNTLQPLIVDVMQKQRAVEGNRFGAMGPRGNRGGDDRGDRGDRRGGGMSTELQALFEVLRSDDASEAGIGNALAALRKANAEAQTALETAQGKLKESVNLRQEAMLVVMGLLK